MRLGLERRGHGCRRARPRGPGALAVLGAYAALGRVLLRCRSARRAERTLWLGMAELPSGTVTFLFTDIEGSTRLLKQLRDALRRGARRPPADPARRVRGARGQEVDTQGDAFFVAFPQGEGRGARRGCGRSAASPRTPGPTARSSACGWACTRVSRASATRVTTASASTGRRGSWRRGTAGRCCSRRRRTRCSRTTSCPGRIRDLGEYRLKDLDRPERIYQLDVDGLPSRLPAAADGRRAHRLHRAGGRAGAGCRSASGARGCGRAAGRGRRSRRRARCRRSAALERLGRQRKALSPVDSNAVGLIDADVGPASPARSPSARRRATSRSARGAAWVTNADADSVSRIDPATKQVVDTIDVGSQPSGIAVGNGAVWVANSLDGTVSGSTRRPTRSSQTIPVGNGPVGVAYAAGSVWVANTGDEHDHADRRRDRQAAKTLPIAATELAVGAGALWASERGGGPRGAHRPESRERSSRPIPVGQRPGRHRLRRAARSGSRTASTGRSRGSIRRRTRSPPPFRSGNGRRRSPPARGGVWVSNQFDGTLARIDPQHEPGRATRRRREPAAGRGDPRRQRAGRRPPVRARAIVAAR